MYIGYGADQPFQQIDVVAGLVHEGSAVHFPCASPFGGIIVFLRSCPEDINMDHVDFAEAFFVHGTLEILESGIITILFNYKKTCISFIASFYHGETVFPACCHGFFRYYMLAVTGGHNCLLGVQTGRRTYGHKIGVGFAEHGFIIFITGYMIFFHMFGQYLGVLVADSHQLEVFRVLFNGTEMVFRYTSAANYGYFDGAPCDKGKHGELLTWWKSEKFDLHFIFFTHAKSGPTWWCFSISFSFDVKNI